MVNIIEFRCRDDIASRAVADSHPGSLPKGHSAEIVIFPGVRIDRQPLDRGDGGMPGNTAKRAKRPAGSNR